MLVQLQKHAKSVEDKDALNNVKRGARWKINHQKMKHVSKITQK